MGREATTTEAIHQRRFFRLILYLREECDTIGSAEVEWAFSLRSPFVSSSRCVFTSRSVPDMD